MINCEREILVVQERLVTHGMDISIIEVSPQVFEAIIKSKNVSSIELLEDTFKLDKRVRMQNSSPFILLIRSKEIT